MLIESPDTFTVSIPVWTYDGGRIIKTECEKFGWPNVTHDGAMMFDNTFFLSEAEAVAKAKRDSDSGIKQAINLILQSEAQTEKHRSRLAEAKAEREKLERDYPSSPNGSTGQEPA
jgi:hypothetical protein